MADEMEDDVVEAYRTGVLGGRGPTDLALRELLSQPVHNHGQGEGKAAAAGAGPGCWMQGAGQLPGRPFPSRAVGRLREVVQLQSPVATSFAKLHARHPGRAQSALGMGNPAQHNSLPVGQNPALAVRDGPQSVGQGRGRTRYVAGVRVQLSRRKSSTREAQRSTTAGWKEGEPSRVRALIWLMSSVRRSSYPCTVSLQW